MSTTRRLAASAVVGLVALLLCGCTPRPPGFVVVGRDSHGTTVGAMVVCSDPPDQAVLGATAQLEKRPPGGTQAARWQFKREALQPGSFVTWALFGSTDRDDIRSRASLEVAPEDAMTLYVQRDPENGASGIDFTMAQVGGLATSQYLYRDSNDRLRRGTAVDVLSAAHC